MLIIKKMWSKRWILRNLFQTIWFNFYYLPLKQAIKLPILLYKPKLLKCKGSVRICNKEIKTGMIVLGYYRVSLYPNNGLVFENNGGSITFHGKCFIGNDSKISVGETGNINFGDCFSSTASLKIISYIGITLGNNVSCGWECLIVDTDFHQMKYVECSDMPPSFGRIRIGNNCWLAFHCIVMKNTLLPNFCTAAAYSLLNKHYEISCYSLVAGQPAVLKKEGIFRDMNDDLINYSCADKNIE